MSKLTPVLMAAALGVAMAMGGGAPYQMAERHMEIHSTDAHEILKARAVQDMMAEARAEAPLPPGMALVLPRGGDPEPIVLASRIA